MAVAIDNRVASVDDRDVVDVRRHRWPVDDKVPGRYRVARCQSMTVKVVDDKVAEVIHGAQIIFSQASEMFNLNRSDGKEAKQVMKQTANDVDLVKRSSSPYISLLRPTVSCR